MVQAVIFDMYETLITHYRNPLYFGEQMAKDAGISWNDFKVVWQATDYDRCIGNATLEEVLERILKENNCYSEKLLKDIAEKRVETKRDCFKHLHKEIIPMFSVLKEKNILIGLISNCFSEEAKVIRESELFTYFDAVFLSYEQGIRKPDIEIFQRCMKELSVKPSECLYVGDGGSDELETARKLGMKALQAVWYLKEKSTWSLELKSDFVQLESPLSIINYL